MNNIVRLAGHYRIEKREVGTNKLTAVREFDNDITDRGLDGYGFGNIRLLQCCYVGTGNTPATRYDTAMEQYAGAARIVSASRTAGTSPDFISSATAVYRFDAGSVVGNFSEIGIGNVGWNPSSGDFLWSRALIRNEQGQPSSISVMANEFLDVYYTMYFHLPIQTESTFTIEILGNTHTVTGKLANAQGAYIQVSWDGDFGVRAGTIVSVKHDSTALGDITGTVNGVETDQSSGGRPYHPTGTLLAYESGSYRRQSTFHFGLENDNYENGISGIEFSTYQYHADDTMNMASQYLITPPIPKTNQRELDLTFQWAWARYPV